MAGRPTRLRDERTHQAKPYQKRRSVLQTVTSAVRQFLTPSWLSESSCESESSVERPELTNGEREPALFVPLTPQPPPPSSPPRPTRDCAVGPDDDETTNGPPSLSVPVIPRPETPLQRSLERPLERPSLGRLSERLADRLSDQSLEQPSRRPASVPSPSSWMSVTAASSKRQKVALIFVSFASLECNV
ncbi:hypothetical protein V5799_013522 [Amblyomma americanum]|uniref:Uncharacterized protein n=1 Tax=Amblyomma americanum TaxID=6943 RepID=A0AAQ4E5M7_AMBAM